MRAKWQTVLERLDGHMERLERLRLPEYIRYIENRRRFMLMQFLGGLARGLGMAVGFTILGAVLVLVLQGLAQRNLPVIGDFLADIVTIVQRRLE
ncbi:MAG: hypothetical protein J1E43_04450 [Christensenellaceae bacterium]|nr:hypothetical protein [Christensenellaceae bacterium]